MKQTTEISESAKLRCLKADKLSDSQIKALGRKELWRLARLSRQTAEELNKSSRRSEPYWFNTSGAAFYCHCKMGEGESDWHSKLIENRRNQNDTMSVLLLDNPPAPRGNVERLGEGRCYYQRRKVYYNSHDLDEWLAGMKSRKVH